MAQVIRQQAKQPTDRARDTYGWGKNMRGTCACDRPRSNSGGSTCFSNRTIAVMLDKMTTHARKETTKKANKHKGVESTRRTDISQVDGNLP